MARERYISVFRSEPDRNLPARLVAAIGDFTSGLFAAPLRQLRYALLPESLADWLPARLVIELGGSARDLLVHPIRFTANTLSPAWTTVTALNASTLSTLGFVDGVFLESQDEPARGAGRKRRWFRPVFAASAAVHSVLILYLLYVAFLSPFAGVRLVNRAYRQFDADRILAPLYYPPSMIPRKPTDRTLTLEEIREREAGRREEVERKKREKAEREKAEQELAKKEKEAAGGGEESKPDEASNTKFGEINEAPIRDIVGKVYELYKEGGLDLEDMNFSVMASFKIEPDGSLSRIRLLKSSGSKVIDRNALEILWNIGESRALGPLADLSSTSIRLDLTQKTTRLTITGFAKTAAEAKSKADLLNLLFSVLRMAQKNSDTAELISLARIKSDNNRIDADLSISRARASEMMRARFNTP